MIPPDFIDEVLARTDIVELVGERVKLRKQGHNHTGLCPFHNEKSPSFSVSEDKQFYYCFGCQASGNALKFVMEFDRLDFIPAVELLAGRVGLNVPQVDRGESPERAERRKSIYDILEVSANFYKDQLRQHATRERAIGYLKSRGLSGEIARDFSLGFAPPGWDNLYSALAKTNQERELLIESGMVVENQEEEREKVYDRFRDRIMFPIRDIRGRVIAFGGRVLGDGKPKYLNSPETPVFHKGRELYGLYESRRHKRRLEQVMIVEGYMDVVALAQFGIDYCVATLGTATTEDHIDRLYRMVSRLVFCFDGDTAGRGAAWKALVVSLPHMRDGRSARFLFLPDGEDPDSLVRKTGKDKFEVLIEESPHLEAFFFDKLSAEVELDSMDGKAALSQLAMPLIATIPEGVFKELMIQRLSELTGLSSEKLVAAWGARPRPASTPRQPTSRQPDYPPPDVPFMDEVPDYLMSGPMLGDSEHPSIVASRRSNRELVSAAITMLLRVPELATRFDDAVYKQLEASGDCGLLLQLVRAIGVNGITSPTVLLALFQEAPEFDQLRLLAEQEALLPVEDLPVEFAGIVNALIQRSESETIQEVRKSLLAKPFGELTTDERALLRDLSRSTPRRSGPS